MIVIETIVLLILFIYQLRVFLMLKGITKQIEQLRTDFQL